MAAHAKLSPSGSACWIICPGSVKLAEQAPEIQDDEFSFTGTKAHALGAFAVSNRMSVKEAAQDIDLTMEYGDFDDSTISAVEAYRSEVSAIASTCSLYYVEHRVSIEYMAPGCWGTLDFAGYDEKTKTVYVVDYKNGVQEVGPEYNSQLMIYAFGFINDLMRMEGDKQDVRAMELRQFVKRVSLTVVQPNDFKSDEPVKTWETDIDTLLLWAFNVLMPAAARTRDSELLCTGSHCRWCNAKLICPELKATAMQISGMRCLDDEGNLPPVESITPENLSELITMQTVFNARGKEAKSYAEQLALSGQQVPGFKLVRPNQKRVFYDGVMANLKDLGINPYTEPKEISVSEAEKRLKDEGYKPKDAKEAIRELWYNAAENAEPVLAPITDRRQEIEISSVTDVFNDLY